MLFTASVFVQPGSSDQDRASVFKTPAGLVIVVADGAGGMGGGALAADSVVGAVRRAVGDERLGDWSSLLRKVDTELRDQGQTTAVIAEVRGSSLLGASVGDSQAWLLTSSSRTEVTRNQERKPLIGTGRASPTAFFDTLEESSVVLVGSDGLFNYTTMTKIAPLALTGGAMSEYIKLVELPSGGLQDDVAIVDCRRVTSLNSA